MPENWLTYCSMKRQKYLRDKLGAIFLDFFVSQYPLLFVDSINGMAQLKKYNTNLIINNDLLAIINEIQKLLEMCPWDTDAPAIAKFL